MNKFFKYGLITAGISMAAGIVFTLIATIIGGRFFSVIPDGSSID